MKKIILLRGLPASGKTTWALEQLNKNPGKYKRINKDELRAMLDDSKWSKDNEKFVLETRDDLIHRSLLEGKSVIIDDTNLHPKHEQHIKELVNDWNSQLEKVEFEVKEFYTPVWECIERDERRDNSVGQKVILDMFLKYKLNDEKITQDESLPSSIVVDIDGTLAIMGDRGPFDWKNVGKDLLNIPIKNLIHKYCVGLKEHPWIILVSGRDESCRKETEEWLDKNEIMYDKLYMREEGNIEKDWVVKKKIFDERVRNQYYVEFVLDDRNQTVIMWRALGLTCLQVNFGNF